MTTKTCRECGKALTDPASQEREYGRDCYTKKFGVPPRRPRSRTGSVAIPVPSSAPVAEQASLNLLGVEHDGTTVLQRAAELVITERFPSPSFLMRKLGIEYETAQEILDQLEALNVVGPHPGGTGVRDVLATPGQLPAILEVISSAGGEA